VLLTGLSAKKASRVGVDAVLCRESDGDTRQRIRPWWRAVTATFLCRGPLLALGKHFAENPRRSSRQSILCRPRLPREPFAECGSRQNFCRVRLRLCRVLGALDKSAASGSGGRSMHKHTHNYPYSSEYVLYVSHKHKMYTYKKSCRWEKHTAVILIFIDYMLHICKYCTEHVFFS
jgi:hypothetical protein